MVTLYFFGHSVLKNKIVKKRKNVITNKKFIETFEKKYTNSIIIIIIFTKEM
ncbi:unnamed protein product [Staurois parvus]|uniref:Uncharacterized protein n=1 Tax=Staurois parvus TaxID=386267 RepID=A0ABN9GX74_9NEOB|nr:unnamed protein product [Staurois parvus]